MEEARLAYITKSACHIVLAVTESAAGAGGSSIITCGNTGGRNTFSIGLKWVTLVARSTLFTASSSVARLTCITCCLLVNVQEACVRKSSGGLVVWTGARLAVVGATSGWVTKEAWSTLIALRPLCVVLAAQTMSADRITGTGMSVTVTPCAGAKIETPRYTLKTS